MGEKTDKTSKKILKLRGSWRAKNRGEEPDPEDRKARLPSELPVDVDQIAEQVRQDIESMGLLAGCDESTINSLAWIEYRIRKTCQWLENYPEHENFDKREGRLVKLSGEARQLRKVLGLGPSYRANLATEKPEKEDELEQLLG